MRFDFERDHQVLARTPVVVRALLEGLDEAWTQSGYGDGTWSAHEIVGHLAYGDRTDWLPRARIIISEGEQRPFTPFDRAGHLEMCRVTTLPELLTMFDDARRESLVGLRDLHLTPDLLAKRGTHPDFGSVTLEQLLCAWVAHDLHHIGHMCKALACQHRDEAGPWRAYLSVLDPPAPR